MAKKLVATTTPPTAPAADAGIHTSSGPFKGKGEAGSKGIGSKSGLVSSVAKRSKHHKHFSRGSRKGGRRGKAR